MKTYLAVKAEVNLMERLKRIAVRTAKVTIIVLLIVAAIHGIATLILGRKVESELAKIKAKGDPIAMSELGQNMPANSENAAVIFESMYAKWPDLQGKYKEYKFDILDPDKRKNGPNSWIEAREIVAASKDDLAIAEIALNRPECKFHRDWNQGCAVLFPDYAKSRSLARLFATRAIIQAKDGRTAEALDSVKSGFKLAETLKQEPTLIGHLVRIALITIATSSLRDVAEIGNVKESDMRQLDALLGDTDLNSSMSIAMKGERCLGIWTFSRLSSWDIRTLLGANTNPHLYMRLMASRWGRPFLYADELHYLQAMSRTIEMADLPSRSTQWREFKLKSQMANSSKSVTDILMPCYCRARESTDKGQANIYASRILLSLGAYRSRFGDYPAQLTDLNAKLGFKAPEDPFSGKDFIYKKQPRGFVLYSVGWNHKDDGGKSLQETKNDNCDIVFKVER